MKILWVTNVPLPEASLLMSEKPIAFGGWLVNAAANLAKEKNIKLEISFPKKGTKKVNILKAKDIIYYTFPSIGYSNKEKKKNNNLLYIIEKSKPDLVHIFGTECAHTLAMVNMCKKKNINVVISIQGLLSYIAEHYMNGIPDKIQKKYTFRDFIKRDNLKLQKNKFVMRGKYEIEAIQKTNHVIGRTTWDNACTSIINPEIQYHHCNETLRDEFYKYSWDNTYCEKYSIFVSQGSYPIKGLHFLLEAMPIILKRYPLAKIYIGGHDITNYENLNNKLKISSYGKYIKSLIKKYKLQEKVQFTGVLNEKEMCKQYLKSNVFVCPSTIENSPNSLGEAMILGVPSVAANVGGISDLLKHKEEGFIYQSDASYMLAHYICEIFGNEKIAINFSQKSKIKASQLHDAEVNNKKLLEIYLTISKKKIFNISS
ncbi:glycosyltransferase family 4 protein [Peribacillus sp. NPDC097206]|uniref:glycosyltransferase family 4 protein n=1 Tax=unclassified Peribacillus TaxID=2675266 RepID=UPI0037F5AF82